IARTLDDIEAVARNPEVAQAMNDAGRSAAAAEELKRRDIATPAEAELAAEADATNKASLAVLRSAVAARQAAKAEKLNEMAIKSRESEAASSTAARFISRHAVAVSTKEIVIAKMGDPAVLLADALVEHRAAQDIQAAGGGVLTQAQTNLFDQHNTHRDALRAQAQAAQTAIQAEVQAVTVHLDTTLRNGADEKAGLRLDATTRKLMLYPAVAADSLINEAKMARIQLGETLGQSATQRKKDANDLQEEIIRQANEVKRAVKANGGDDMEGTLAAVAFIERRVAIERAVTDAVLARRETIQLTGEDEEAREFIKYVRDQVEGAQKATKEQGMDLAAQIAAGAAEATNIAQLEKNMRNGVRAAISSIDQKDRKKQIDVARKAFVEISNNTGESRDKIAQEVIYPFVAKSLQKYTNEARELKTAAYQREPAEAAAQPGRASLPQLYNVPDKNTLPADLQADHANWQITYDTNEQELTAIIKQSKSKLMDKYIATINDEKRKGKNILDQNRAGIAAVMGDIALTESIIDMQNARMSNIANPGENAPVANRMQYNKDLQSERINAEKEIQDVYNKAFDGATGEDISKRYAIAAAAVKSHVLIEQSVIDAKDAAEASIPALAAAPPPIQEDRDIREKQIEDAKINAEVRVRNAAKTILDANAEKDPIEQYAVAAQAAFREAGNANQDDSSAEVYKAGRNVEVAAATMRDTVRVGQYTFAAAQSSAFRARIVEIERAIKGLTPEQAEEVRNTAKKAYDDATASNKDLIAQHADAADAGVRKAYELREGNTDSKTLAWVGNEARKAVEAAVASTEADIAKARGGTDTQTTTAKNAARCATAQADIAQAIKVVGPHARTRAPQLTELGHEPATTP
ncbi:MAG TPA: hypothetical protein VHV10_13690, partial [Ktedonobacteraceae bacterium]|nr:hypothetical protein [Ktedonobacteraceae bacterium]